MKPQLNFRIVVEEPLAGVTYAVQRGRFELLAPKRSSRKKLTFEFPLTLADIDTEPPRLTGEYAQGPASKRFVYVNTGTAAGQKNTPWTRRAKIPLYGIERAVLEQAKDGNLVLEAQFHGIGKDGGPACATVPLTREWSIARDVPETDFNLVRELAESLPDVVHAVSSRGEGLKVRGKLMACQATHKSADPNSIMARVSDTDRSRLIESDPKTYYITKHYENYPAVLVRLSLVGRAELERLLKISWQYVFEKSQMPGGV